MQLTELLNPGNVYRFTLTNGRELIGQVTREGEDFLQIGTQEGQAMVYRWVNIGHIILLEYLATNFREADRILSAAAITKKPATKSGKAAKK